MQINDRKQHEYHSRLEHGAVRMKEPPPLRYTGPLATENYHKLERQFTNLFLSARYEQMKQLKKQTVSVLISKLLHTAGKL